MPSRAVRLAADFGDGMTGDSSRGSGREVSLAADGTKTFMTLGDMFLHGARLTAKLAMVVITAGGLLVAEAQVSGAAAQDRPDSAQTPGAIDPRVTQANIRETICSTARPTWTERVRPDVVYTEALKKRLLGLRFGDRNPRHYELDHVIPIGLGGAPDDPRNMWLEHWSDPWGAHTKDRLELKLIDLVCSRRVLLATAQAAIATDWIAAYQQYCPTEMDCPDYEERKAARRGA